MNYSALKVSLDLEQSLLGKSCNKCQKKDTLNFTKAQML